MYKRIMNIIIPCLWCKKDFKPKTQNQHFCSRECADAYRKMKKQISNLDFDHDFKAEMGKLTELGKGYKLPERIVD